MRHKKYVRHSGFAALHPPGPPGPMGSERAGAVGLVVNLPRGFASKLASGLVFMQSGPKPSLFERLVVPALVVLCVVVACGGGVGSGDLAGAAQQAVGAVPGNSGDLGDPGNAGGAGNAGNNAAIASVPLKVTELATGLANPWGMVFLSANSVLVTERGGSMRIVNLLTGSKSAPIAGLPAVNSAGQGGLLDVALDPAYARNRRIYFTFSENDFANSAINSTAVGRAEFDESALALRNFTVIFRQSPKVASTAHYGSRLVFDKNGYLFVTLGDRQSNEQRGFAQDLTRGNGKVMRITTDGAAAPGNPVLGPGAQAGIWSYGHRNPQGAALHPTTGALWVNEHGPQGGDELNLVSAGNNYGWPTISYGQEYGSTVQVGEGSAKAGLQQPVSTWLTRDGSQYAGGAKSSIAPSGMAIYQGDKFPEFRGNVFIGALAGTALWRVVLGGPDGQTEIARQRLLDDRAERIRDVRNGPDGWLYLLTDSSDGKLLRVAR